MRGHLTPDRSLYLVALGSNQRHARHGPPPSVLRAALAAIEAEGIAVLRASPVIATAPLGPSLRRYANAAALVRTQLDPPALLDVLQQVERDFGRKRRGRRWRERVLDLDIVLWSGGKWTSSRLAIPHPEFRQRAFVLVPASAIAGGWRDPATGRTITHLAARLTRRGPAPR